MSFWERLARDVCHGLRMLGRSPGFTATAVAVIALGIGANSAVFSVVNAVLLKPLPYPEADRLVRVMLKSPGGMLGLTSVLNFNVWRQTTRAFDLIAAYDGGTTDGQLKAARVSADYFPLFGGQAAIGRTFSADDDRRGGPRVAVIGDELWRRRFGGDGSLAGKRIAFDGGVYDVICVIRPEFAADPPADLWLPLQAEPHTLDQTDRIAVAARLKGGVTVEMARRQMRFAAIVFARTYPQILNSQENFTVEPMRDVVVGDVRPALALFGGAVALVLLIACANVANLLLARSSRRRREMATRVALGASRNRIVSQLLTESLLLAVGGGALGLLLGHFGVRGLLAAFPGSLPRIGAHGADVALDWRACGFAAALSIVTGILFGLLPAIGASRVQLSGVMKEGGAQPGRASMVRSALVVAETALALMLLAGAGLMVRTLAVMERQDRGFDAQNVLTVEMPLTEARYQKTAAVTQLLHDAELDVRGIPGVTSFAAASSIPLEPSLTAPFAVHGWEPSRGSHSLYHGAANWHSVSPGYFAVFRIALLKGRVFAGYDTSHDTGHDAGYGNANGAKVAVINQTMAKRFWQEDSPVGVQITVGDHMHPDWVESRTIVGVVADVRDTGLDRDPEAIIYVPAAQVGDGRNAFASRTAPLTFVIRTAGDPHALQRRIEAGLQTASGGLAFGRVRTMEQVVADSTARVRFSMMLLAIFAAIALLLAAIGLYGLIAYSVEQRTQEIGIRMALGAQPRDVRNMVLMYGMRLALAGVAIGVEAALALGRLMNGFLYGVRSWDPAALAFVAVLLLAVALTASFIPSLRAIRVDPMEALRCG
jgi:putative ABC transport system permease protein